MDKSKRDGEPGLGKTIRIKKSQQDIMQELRELGVLSTDDANTVRVALDQYLEGMIERAFRRRDFQEAMEHIRETSQD